MSAKPMISQPPGRVPRLRTTLYTDAPEERRLCAFEAAERLGAIDAAASPKQLSFAPEASP